MRHPHFLIVGSGILGTTTAFYLSKLGYRITVIDRDEVGRATKHAAGIICPWVAQRRNQDWYTLARLGAKMYPDLVDELETDYNEPTSYQKVGALSLHDREERLESMIERTTKRKEIAPEIGDIIHYDSQYIEKHFPMLKEGFEGVFVSGAARIHGEAFRLALVEASKKNGVQFIHEDVQFLMHNGQITGLESVKTNKQFFSEQIIITNGAWEKELLQTAKLTSEAHGQKAHLVHFSLPQTKYDFAGFPVIKPPNNQYLLFNEDGTVSAGTTYERTNRYDPSPSAKGIHDILAKALDIVPSLEQATIQKISVGFRPVIQHSLPYFGRLNGHNSHVLLANGLGASGLNTGPFIGSTLAKLAANQKIDEIDISRYEPNIYEET